MQHNPLLLLLDDPMGCVNQSVSQVSQVSQWHFLNHSLHKAVTGGSPDTPLVMVQQQQEGTTGARSGSGNSEAGGIWWQQHAHDAATHADAEIISTG
jgi:hypothetical protein